MVFAPQETSLPGTQMQTGPLWPGQEENPERFEGARRKAKASERRSFLHTAPLHNNRYGIFIRMSVKDRGAANDYGPMVFIDSSHVEQWFQISLTIGKGDYPDKTFDPKRVWSIVVLLQTTE